MTRITADTDTTLSCATSPSAPLDPQYSSREPTRGFFLTPYSRADPGPLFGVAPSRLAWVGSVARIFGRLFGARA